VCSPWLAPEGALSVLVMEESPPARRVAIWQCAGDQAMDRICSLVCNFLHSTPIRIVNQRLDRCYGAARVAFISPLSGPQRR
jgi:hypothetical protein